MTVPVAFSVYRGDYGLVDIAGTFNGLIRFGDEGADNHAFTFIEDTTASRNAAGAWTVQGGSLVEAGDRGMVNGDITYYLGNSRHFSVSGDILTSAQRDRIVLEARYEVGDKVPYGFLDIALLALARFGIRLAWLHRRIAAQHRLICSQAVARQYLAGGVNVMPNHDDIDVTPETLALRTGVRVIF